MKRVALAVLTFVFCVFFSGCSSFTAEINEYIVPPTPSGKLYDIQQALYGSVGTDITLRYPKSGDYKSAFVVRDIDGDAEEEALAFYSTLSSDNTTVMHINLITKNGEHYTSVNDYSVECAGVNSVGFADISGDGNPEIIVTWLIPSSPTDKISVFYYDNSTMTKYIEEEYLTYTVCDIDARIGNELLIVSKDIENGEGYARLFEINEEDVLVTSECFMDSDIQSYQKPVLSTLKDGRNAVYIDAAKGTEGTVTELLFCDNEGNLINPFVKTKNDKNTETLRAAHTFSKDINGDGIYEIPFITQLPEIQDGEEREPLYLTEWREYSGEEFEVVASSLIDYSEGYTIIIPNGWANKITAEKSEDGEKTVYLYNEKTEKIGEEIFRVKLISNETWEGSPEKYQGYFEAARSDKSVLAIFINQESELDITKEYFLENSKFN